MSETRVRPTLRGKDLILAILRWILIIFFALYTLFPLIWLAVSSLKSAGAFAAQMTGSGSAVFGAFRSRALAEKGLAVLSRRYRSIHLCHTQSDSVRISEEEDR